MIKLLTKIGLVAGIAYSALAVVLCGHVVNAQEPAMKEHISTHIVSKQGSEAATTGGGGKVVAGAEASIVREIASAVILPGSAHDDLWVHPNLVTIPGNPIQFELALRSTDRRGGDRHTVFNYFRTDDDFGHLHPIDDPTSPAWELMGLTPEDFRLPTDGSVELPEGEWHWARNAAFINSSTIVYPFLTRNGNRRSVRTVVSRKQGEKWAPLYVSNALANDAGRGLLEPQIVQQQHRLFMTMRAEDGFGYVSVSADNGRSWSEPQAWRWDNGEKIPMHTTMTKLLSHSDGMLLVYTRIREDNRDVFRSRAPLHCADVDPRTLSLRRPTERVIIPNRGLPVGNFWVWPIDQTRSYVCATEWPRDGRAANGDTWLAKIYWKRPNQRMSPNGHRRVGSEESSKPKGIQWGNPLCTSFVTVYDWNDRRLISDAPALVKLPDGTLLCAVELWSRDGFKGADRLAEELYGQNRCLIFGSTDGGATWQERSRLPFATGKFLLHEGTLYFIGSGIEWQGLYITRSSDGGQTWDDPVLLREGKVYAASTGWVVRDGTLYWAADDMSPSVKDRAVFAFSCDLSRDPLDVASWTFSNDERHPGLPQSFGRGGHNGGKWLEPNVVDVGGKLLVIVRVRTSQGKVDANVPNVAAVCDLENDGNGELKLSFSHYYPFPGGQNQFHIVRDKQAKLFWMTSNQVTGMAEHCYRGWGKERRFLMLHYSRDAQNWFPAGVLAMWRKETQSFNYCTPVIDGTDLLFVSRTSQDATNQHDNDCITFHRLQDFRKTAVDLQPEPTRRKQ